LLFTDVPCFAYHVRSPTDINTFSLHDALPICVNQLDIPVVLGVRELPNLTCDYVGLDYVAGARVAVEHLIHEKKHERIAFIGGRSEEHTSELQSRFDLVCRLLLEKKNKRRKHN